MDESLNMEFRALFDTDAWKQVAEPNLQAKLAARAAKIAGTPYTSLDELYRDQAEYTVMARILANPLAFFG